MNIIFIIGFFLPLFYFALIISKKNKTLSDKTLAFLILAIGVHLLSYYLNQEGYWNKYPHLVGLSVPITFIYSPLMYLYIYYSINKTKSFRKQDIFHFLSFALVFLYMSKFYFLYSEEEKRLVDQGLNNDFDIFTYIIYIIFVVSVIFYSIKAIMLVRLYKKMLADNYSNIKLFDMKWIRNFIWGFGFVFFPVVIVIITQNLIGFEYPFNPELVFNSMVVLVFILFGFFGIRNQNVFVNKTTDIIAEIENDDKLKPIYENSGLKADLANEKYKELLNYMVIEKPYLESKLSLTMLAKGLKISTNHLSQIINQYEKKNFNDFVNGYRIDEFIDKSSQNSHLNFLALALDSGFNSKSTFNAAFKKHKGKTPSQYITAM